MLNVCPEEMRPVSSHGNSVRSLKILDFFLAMLSEASVKEVKFLDADRIDLRPSVRRLAAAGPTSIPMQPPAPPFRLGVRAFLQGTNKEK